MTDSWLLQELAKKIESADEARKVLVQSSLFEHPLYVTVLIRVHDEALRTLGMSGSDVVDATLLERYGLHKEDLAYNPSAYMSALKDILDSGCEVLERYMLEVIRKETGIVAMSIEEAVFALKKCYGEQKESEQHLSVRVEDAGHERSPR